MSTNNILQGDIFSTEVCNDATRGTHIVHEMNQYLNGLTKAGLRMDLSQNVPKILGAHRLLTEAELRKGGYYQMSNRVPHYVRSKQMQRKSARTKKMERIEAQLFPFACYFSPEGTCELGLWVKMQAVREFFTRSGCEEKLLKCCSPRHLQLNGHKYEMAFSYEIGHDVVHLGPIVQGGDPEIREINKLIVDIGMVLLRNAFTDRNIDIHKINHAANGAITIGWEDNFETTSIQVNISTPGQAKEKLGDSGSFHIDGHDDVTSMSAMFCLSNLDDNYFPGRFNIASTRITATTSPFSALVFTGRHPHFGCAEGPYEEDLAVDSPLRDRLRDGLKLPQLPEGHLVKRVVVVPYPKERLLAYNIHFKKEDLLNELSLKAWGTLRNRQEHAMRRQIREQYPQGDRQSAQWWVNEHGCADENGDMVYPRLEMAERALKHVGQPNYEYLKLKVVYKSFLCGTIFNHKKDPEGGKDNDTEWDRHGADLLEENVLLESSAGHTGVHAVLHSHKPESETKKRKTTDKGKCKGPVIEIDEGASDSGTPPAKRAKGPSNKRTATKLDVKVGRYKGNKTGVINWTHTDMDLSAAKFDPYSDLVPGNPNWQPFGREDAEMEAYL